jgi:CTP:molybdopterin cytidylyltransferase MocA
VTGIAGLLLAAGEGRRLGQPKALVQLDGETLAERGVHTLRSAGCEPVVVVVGAAADRVLRLPGLAGAITVTNDAWRSGLASSLRAGLAACSDAEAAVVALADQPEVSPEAVRRLCESWRAARPAAVVAGYDGVPRNPVLLDATVWPEVVASAVGDTGARGWLQQNAHRAVVVECADVASARDVDTPAELAEVRRRSADP